MKGLGGITSESSLNSWGGEEAMVASGYPRPREVRAFFSCLAWRVITSPLSKVKRRLDSLEATQGAPRYPRRDSGGERSPLLPLEARPDSPGVEEGGPCLRAGGDGGSE